MQLTQTFLVLLREFQCVFTQPSFATFVALLTGWTLTHRHRYVTELIQASGSTHKGHHSRYHRFFSHARWSLDTLSLVLAKILVRLFASTGLIEMAVDDTLCRKRGLTVYGTGMHHDPLISSRAKPLVSWGHDWVVLCLILRCPCWAPTKVWCLPILFRLYRNRQGLTKGRKGQKPKPDPNHRSRPQLAVELIQLFASWFPQRHILVSGDSAYGGHSVLRHLPGNVELISHVHPKGGLYAPPPPPIQGQRGRRCKKGIRLPAMAAWAADRSQHWRALTFDQFGLHATLWVKSQQALYYKAGKDRLLTIVLVHDPEGKRPEQMFYCTLLDWDVRQILSAYACRWAIEVTFENSKQLLGLEDAANRLPQAVQRTAPMALVLYSLVVVWFHRFGHAWLRFPDRPWYRKKVEPSFADLLTTLRRDSWQEQFRVVCLQSSAGQNLLAQVIDFVSRSG
ncbi:MAG: IS701 family transposase [bacterium]